MSENIWAQTELNFKNRQSMTAETLYLCVKSLYASSNYANDEVTSIIRKIARDLEQDLDENDLYIYRNYVKFITNEENNKVRLKMRRI